MSLHVNQGKWSFVEGAWREDAEGVSSPRRVAKPVPVGMLEADQHLAFSVLPSGTVTEGTASPMLSMTCDQNQRYRLHVARKRVLKPVLSTAYSMVSNSS